VKTKQQFITEYKTQFPTIKVGSEELGYTLLKSEEYETTIDEWAEKALYEQAKQKAIAQAATDKAALLDKLGINADEAKLLLS